MIVECPIPLGELIDKVSILTIKSEKITDSSRKKLVFNELKELSLRIDSLNLKNLSGFLDRLVEINGELWDIEDKIRIKEKKKEFDEEFIQLARSVYRVNDRRFEVKHDINSFYGSELKEVKSYEEYE